MHVSLRIALIVLTLIYILYVLRSLKHKKILISFSIFWLFTGMALIIALVIPNFIEGISDMLGFELTVNMIFCIAIFMCFYLIFSLNILLSKEYRKNVTLVQELSIIKKRVNEIDKNNKTK